jgi:hypothetical protein
LLVNAAALHLASPLGSYFDFLHHVLYAGYPFDIVASPTSSSSKAGKQQQQLRLV